MSHGLQKHLSFVQANIVQVLCIYAELSSSRFSVQSTENLDGSSLHVGVCPSQEEVLEFRISESVSAPIHISVSQGTN